MCTDLKLRDMDPCAAADFDRKESALMIASIVHHPAHTNVQPSHDLEDFILPFTDMKKVWFIIQL